MGLQAVCSIGGSNGADTSDWTPLTPFREVVLVPDKDEPDESYARDVAVILSGLPGSRNVTICRLPGLPDKGDVVDWLQARVPVWDGFGEIPREPGTDYQEDLLSAIDASCEPLPPEWIEIEPEAVAWDTPPAVDRGGCADVAVLRVSRPGSDLR